MKMILACFASLLLATPQLANTYHVPGDFADVQTAINAASPNDTIVIHGGTWAGLVIDKPLRLIGEPTAAIESVPSFGQLDSPITLAGPGSGTVVLSRLEIGGTANGAVYYAISPGIEGGGFAELHVYDSEVSGPHWQSLTGLAEGAAGIFVTVPYVVVERCTVVGSDTDNDGLPLTSSPPGPAGIDTTGTVVLLDSTVHGGDVGYCCLPSTYCPPTAPPGDGGPGVRCIELIHSNSTITAGEGAEWYADQSYPGSCGVYCIDSADGIPVDAAIEYPMFNDLMGSGPLVLGTPFTLSWTTPGPLARLYMGPGIIPPWILWGVEYVFLDPTFAIDLGPVPSPGGVTTTIPMNLSLVGVPVGFQVHDPQSGLSRPVSGRLLP